VTAGGVGGPGGLPAAAAVAAAAARRRPPGGGGISAGGVSGGGPVPAAAGVGGGGHPGDSGRAPSAVAGIPAPAEHRFASTRAPPGGRLHRNRYYATVRVHSTAPPSASVQKPAPYSGSRPLATAPVRECTETVAPRGGWELRRCAGARPAPAAGTGTKGRPRPRGMSGMTGSPAAGTGTKGRSRPAPGVGRAGRACNPRPRGTGRRAQPRRASRAPAPAAADPFPRTGVLTATPVASAGCRAVRPQGAVDEEIRSIRRAGRRPVHSRL
jgi:hypothetical protein